MTADKDSTNCGLRFILSPGALPTSSLETDEEDLVAFTQAREDDDTFGPRELPSDLGDSSLVEAPQLSDHFRNRSTFDKTTSQNRATLPPSPQKRVTFADQSGDSQEPPLLQWLSQTVQPRGAATFEQKEPLAAEEIPCKRPGGKEVEEIEIFQNIHLLPSANQSNSPAPLRLHEGQADIELGEEVYLRNIRDRYPKIESFLALRLARANWARAKRLNLTKNAASVGQSHSFTLTGQNSVSYWGCRDTLSFSTSPRYEESHFLRGVMPSNRSRTIELASDNSRSHSSSPFHRYVYDLFVKLNNQGSCSLIIVPGIRLRRRMV